MKMKLEGYEDVLAGLFELKSSTAKSVARRVLKKAAQPVADETNEAAPERAEDHEGARLKGSYTVTSRLNRSQAAQARKEGRDDVYMYIGTNNPAGQQQEFGNAHHEAQPHFRPVWDGRADEVLQEVTEGMKVEVGKSVARARRKAAKG